MILEGDTLLAVAEVLASEQVTVADLRAAGLDAPTAAHLAKADNAHLAKMAKAFSDPPNLPREAPQAAPQGAGVPQGTGHHPDAFWGAFWRKHPPHYPGDVGLHPKEGMA